MSSEVLVHITPECVDSILAVHLSRRDVASKCMWWIILDHMGWRNAGIRIFCTEERSQGKNRERAMAILRSRLFALEQEKQQSEIAAQRKSQVWCLGPLSRAVASHLRFWLVTTLACTHCICNCLS